MYRRTEHGVLRTWTAVRSSLRMITRRHWCESAWSLGQTIAHLALLSRLAESTCMTTSQTCQELMRVRTMLNHNRQQTGFSRPSCGIAYATKVYIRLDLFPGT
ncbi:hypothetical protein PYCCODRAFT_682737 [Trametes coccinea BRFM310]|uniref:Uncharacterized protein n=1 Tax=Trametes coccinea (strain BRFM310) TaxID=1353009 RepID=A0A1Y2IH08_TRAC3|nr:hypothetical protein PYCCODRAFT_682737 [Trametes coccinea BRFM310]